MNTQSQNTKPLNDPDLKRSLSLITKSTSNLMTQSEISELKSAVESDMSLNAERGVALNILKKAESGHILSTPEAMAVAKSVAKNNTLGEPWFHLFEAVSEDISKDNFGVRDPGICARLNKKINPSACSCGRGTCSECNVCPFYLKSVGGEKRAGLLYKIDQADKKKREDCGCKGDESFADGLWRNQK